MTPEEIADIALKASKGDLPDQKTVIALCYDNITMRQELKRIRR